MSEVGGVDHPRVRRTAAPYRPPFPTGRRSLPAFLQYRVSALPTKVTRPWGPKIK